MEFSYFRSAANEGQFSRESSNCKVWRLNMRWKSQRPTGRFCWRSGHKGVSWSLRLFVWRSVVVGLNGDPVWTAPGDRLFSDWQGAFEPRNASQTIFQRSVKTSEEEAWQTPDDMDNNYSTGLIQERHTHKSSWHKCHRKPRVMCHDRVGWKVRCSMRGTPRDVTTESVSVQHVTSDCSWWWMSQTSTFLMSIVIIKIIRTVTSHLEGYEKVADERVNNQWINGE